jgi:hypothetical protein
VVDPFLSDVGESGHHLVSHLLDSLDSWNRMPSAMKNVRTVGEVKRKYKNTRAEQVTPT